MKTHTRIAKAAAATAMMLLASCSMPVQVPVQTQQQQQNTQTFVDQLRKLVQGPSQTSRAYPWEEFVADPLTAPQPLPQVVWPALGAGDYQPVVIPDVLPTVIWPAPGAGDFQTAAPRPIYWHTVGVDERELVPPVVAPPVNNVAPENRFAINPAREAAAERALRVTPQTAPRLTRQDVAERAAQRAVDGPNWTPPERETAYEFVIAINPAREAAAERVLRVTSQSAPRLTRQDVAERAAQRAVDGPTGDVQTAALRPIYWHTVGVDERELVPPVVAPPVNNVAPENEFAINPAREAAAERALRVTPQSAPRLTRQDVAERAAQRAAEGP